MKRRSFALGLTMLLSIATFGATPGCARLATEPHVVTPISGSRSWLAGAASADITPIVGYPMGGHSVAGEIGIGVWTRLQAHAIYVEDGRGQPVVFVACDLWSIPAGLVDRVATLLAHAHGITHVGREHLVIGATHTHHSPGNYSSSAIYNRFASPASGFDPDLFEFLAQRIASAVTRAVAAKNPVVAHHGAVAVPAVARNRSLEPFLRDPESTAMLATNQALPGCPEVATTHHEVDPCHAVDPVLEVIRFTARDDPDHVVAVAGFFAVHATSMPNKTGVYHGDLFAVATARARAAFATSDRAPVVALFNGAEGDVSPNWGPQGRISTVSLGDALARGIVTAAREAQAAVEGDITVAFARESLAGSAVTIDGRTWRAADRPVPGRSLPGGAEDGRTRFYEHGYHEGIVGSRTRKDGHGVKKPLVPVPLLALGLPRAAVPRSVPLGAVRFGPITFVTLPGEFTTVMGRRIEDAIAARTVGAGPVIAIGLAGEYLSYFTTPEEYGLQHYEGASTLYGEHAGEVIRGLLAVVADRPAAHGPVVHRAGRVHRFGIHQYAAARRRVAKAESRVLAALGVFGHDLPRMTFEDQLPKWPAASPDAATTPRVHVETRGAEGRWEPLRVHGRPVADDGVGFVLHVGRTKRDRLTWTVTWLEPIAPDPSRELRLAVVRVDGSALCSSSFRMESLYRTGELPSLATGTCGQ